MRIILLILLVALITISCSSQKKISKSKLGDNRTIEVNYIDDNTYQLEVASDDNTYGYLKENPVNVGGVKEMSGPSNERRFLNALLGPNGEEVGYYRVGSCCSFKTPNGYLNKSGLLDYYKVYIKGGNDTLIMYLNMYDKGDLKIPVGFSARK